MLEIQSASIRATPKIRTTGSIQEISEANKNLQRSVGHEFCRKFPFGDVIFSIGNFLNYWNLYQIISHERCHNNIKYRSMGQLLRSYFRNELF